MTAERATTRVGVQSVLGTFAQLTQGIIGLALLLVGHQAHLSVAISALAVSAYAIGMSIGRPLQGRALDTRAPAEVLAGCGAVHGLAYVLIAIAAHAHSGAGFIAASLVAGVALPPIATQMRASWPQLAGPDHQTRVFALITTLQTVSVLVAPVVFTVIAAVSSAITAMLGVAALSSVCSVLFGYAARHDTAAARDSTRVRVRRYLTVLLVTGLLGAVTGTVEVAAPAIALAAGHPGVAGPLVALATLGTLIGGLFAMRTRRASSRMQLLVGLSLQTAGAVLLLVPASLAVAGAALVIMGAGFAPALAAVAVLMSRHGGGTAESFGWQSTALGLGVAAGSALAGALAAENARLSALPALLGAAACAALCSAVHVETARITVRF